MRAGTGRQALRDALGALVASWGGAETGLPDLPAQVEGDLLASLTWHDVLTDIGPALAQAGDLPLVRAAHRSARQLSAVRTLQAASDLRWLQGLLAGAEIPWALTKGMAVAHTSYDDPLARSFLDLDVLVRPRDLRRVIELLEAAGCLPLDTDWAALDAEDSGELPLVLPQGSLLDLHWNLVNSRAKRRVIDVPTDELVERARLVEVAGVRLPVLDASDQFLHVALHAYISGGRSLKWCRDLDRTSRRVIWHDVRQRALAWGVAPVVAVLVDRADRVLGLPAARAELEPLRPGWAVLLRLTDHRYGPLRGHEHVGHHTGTDLLWATRATIPASVAALVRGRRPAVTAAPASTDRAGQEAARERWLARRDAGL